MEKITKEQVKIRFKNRGLTLLEEYNHNPNKRLKCIDNQGYLYATSLVNIDKFNCANTFSTVNPYAYDNYLTFMKTIKNGIKLISQEAKKDCEKVEFECGYCGEHFFIRWGDFRKAAHHACKSCALKKGLVNKRIKLEDVKQEFPELIIFNTSWANTDEPLIVQDKEGYKASIDYYNYKKGRSFDKVNKNNPFATHNLKVFLEKYGKGLKLCEGAEYQDKNKKKLNLYARVEKNINLVGIELLKDIRDVLNVLNQCQKVKYISQIG